MTAARYSRRYVKHLLSCCCGLAPAAVASAAAPAGYESSFGDTFDSTSTAWTYTTNATVAGGALTLDTVGNVEARASTATFWQRFGYWEADIKISGADVNLGQSFWLNTPKSLVAGNAIDRSEIGQEFHTPSDVTATVGDWAPAPVVVSQNTVTAGVDLTTGFHTYGLEWRHDNSVHGYLDGNLIWSVSGATVDQLNNLIPLETIFSTAPETGTTVADGARMEVDAVRVYDAPGFTGAAGGDWGNDASWGDGAHADLVTGGAHAKAAVFNRAVAAGSENVTLSSDKQVRQVYIDTANVQALTFSGTNGAKLRLGYAGAGGAGGITVNNSVANSQTFAVPVVAEGPVTFSNFSATPGVALNLDGGISAAAAGQTVNFLTTGAVNVGGSIDSTVGPVVKAGAGTVSLNAANSFTGPLAVQQGVVKVGVAGALPAGTAVTVSGGPSGGTLDLNGFAQTVGSLAGNGNVIVSAPLTVGSDNSSTSYTGAFSGSAPITKIGSGTLTLGSGSANYTSPWTFAGGVTVISASTSVGGGGGSIFNFDGGTLRITNGFGTSKGGSFSANNGTIDVPNAATAVTLSGAFSGSGGFTKTGAGTLAFGATNTYKGPTVVQEGTLKVNNNLSLPASVTALTVSGGTLDINGRTTTVASLVLDGGAIVDSAGTAGVLSVSSGAYDLRAGTVSAKLGGNVALAKNGTGTVVLSGANSYTGATTVTGGTLQLGNATAISAGALAVTGGTLDIKGTSRTLPSIVIDGGSVIDSAYTGANFLQLTGAGAFYDFRAGTSAVRIGGNFPLVKSGTGTMTMAGPNASFIGTTTVREGTLAVSVNAPSGSAGALGNSTTAVALSDASTPAAANVAFLTGGAVTVGRQLLVNNNNPSGETTIGGGTADGSTFTNTITIRRPVQLTAAAGGTVTFAGAITGASGPHGVTKVGPGTVVLANVGNSYTGGTTVREGTLKLGVAEALPAAGVTVAGGTLDMNGIGRTLNAVLLDSGSVVDSTGTASTTLNVAAGGTLEVRSGTSAVRLGGSGVTLNKTTTGTVVLSASNNYTGGTNIVAGTLQMGAASVLPGTSASGTVTVGAGGTLDLAGFPQTVPAFVLDGGTFADSAPTVGSYLGLIAGNPFDVRSGNVNARLGSAAPMVKSGAGTASLNARSTYTGGTTVQGGTLTVAHADGLGSGGVTVNGGTLALAAGLPKALKVPSLSFDSLTAPSGKVDVADNNLVIDYTGATVADSVRQALRAGVAGGAWTGNGIVSSAAAADGRLGLVYLESAAALGLSGTATANWSGQTVDATAVLLRLALYGDTDLSGAVDADDYVRVDRNMALAVASPAWTDGDFDYDGTIGTGDYLLMDKAFVLQSGGGGGAMDPGLLADREARFGSAYVSALVASVPEPTGLGLATVAGLGLLGRRTRRRRA